VNLVNLFEMSRPTSQECQSLLGLKHFATQKILFIDAIYLSYCLKKSSFTNHIVYQFVATLEQILLCAREIGIPFDGIDQIADVVLDPGVHAAIIALAGHSERDDKVGMAVYSFDRIFESLMRTAAVTNPPQERDLTFKLFSDWRKKLNESMTAQEASVEQVPEVATPDLEIPDQVPEEKSEAKPVAIRKGKKWWFTAASVLCTAAAAGLAAAPKTGGKQTLRAIFPPCALPLKAVNNHCSRPAEQGKKGRGEKPGVDPPFLASPTRFKVATLRNCTSHTTSDLTS
jgi:hypothetical protein